MHSRSPACFPETVFQQSADPVAASQLLSVGVCGRRGWKYLFWLPEYFLYFSSASLRTCVIFWWFQTVFECFEQFYFDVNRGFWRREALFFYSITSNQLPLPPPCRFPNTFEYMYSDFVLRPGSWISLVVWNYSDAT